MTKINSGLVFLFIILTGHLFAQNSDKLIKDEIDSTKNQIKILSNRKSLLVDSLIGIKTDVNQVKSFKDAVKNAQSRKLEYPTLLRVISADSAELEILKDDYSNPNSAPKLKIKRIEDSCEVVRKQIDETLKKIDTLKNKINTKEVIIKSITNNPVAKSNDPSSDDICGRLVESFDRKIAASFQLKKADSNYVNNIKVDLQKSIRSNLCPSVMSKLNANLSELNVIINCFGVYFQSIQMLSERYNKEKSIEMNALIKKCLTDNRINSYIVEIFQKQLLLLQGYCQKNNEVFSVYKMSLDPAMDLSFLKTAAEQELLQIKQSDYPYLYSLLDKIAKKEHLKKDLLSTEVCN